MTSALLAVDELWLGGWRGPSLLRVQAGRFEIVGPVEGEPPAEAQRLGGVALPGFVDSHVHLGLVDATALVAGGLAGVLDLGSAPRVVTGLAADARRAGGGLPEVEFAGAFLTAPGGYPSDRAWAPRESFVEVFTVTDARAAVATMAGLGAKVIKIALHSIDGPTLPDRLVTAVVDRAHAVGLPVVAHSEGPGQAMRALALGVDVLSHTPFTDLLDDREIAVQASRVAWISTLDIHGHGTRTPEFEVAQRNLRRFAAAGGRVLYGTDLGNGDLPLGLNPRELEALFDAGLDLDAVLTSLSGRTLRSDLGTRLSWTREAVPTPDTTTPNHVRWLMSTSVVEADAVKELLP